ncbi:hypothetical protein LUZ60_007140 [Juncus effusus]|nr:hypothetical protein LUZ60_007140 [Juncus effusus]
MGCVWSKRRGDNNNKGAVQAVHDTPELGYSAKRTSAYNSLYDSGELAIMPNKHGTGKFVESSIGRGLEKAVEVLDTLGSSMSSLNTGSGFITGVQNRGNRISILAFEVANTIAKAASLWKSFSEESIRDLKSGILKSDGVRFLVSEDERELMSIAASDKRDELAHFAREVIRFGDLCKDPVWHNLGRYFQQLESDFAPQDQSKEEMEKTVQQLIDLAQNTSELYHELHALDRFEQDYHRKFHEEKSLNGARKESLMILLSELKRQRKFVKGLKKKSLWSKTLEEVVEKLVDILVFLHKQIRDAFTHEPSNNFTKEEKVQSRKLGELGLALHYANIINQIDNIVCRPLSLPPSARDNLYHGLPISVKSSLRSKLHISDDKNEYTVAQIKNEMQKTLNWIVPVAENTIRAHQGFGWVGEWANIGSEMSKKSNTSITRLQTLYHADKEKTEEFILNLVISLHHLVIQVKNRGYGFKSQDSKSVKNNSNSNSQTSEAPSSSPLISGEEREMLEGLREDLFRGLKRSKSWDSEKREKIRVSGLSRSLGSSPNREFGDAVECFEGEKIRVLDVMDGLDIGFC